MIRKIHKNNRNKTDTCLEGWGVGDTHFTGSHIGGIHISLGICVRGYTYHGDTHITVTPLSFWAQFVIICSDFQEALSLLVYRNLWYMDAQVCLLKVLFKTWIDHFFQISTEISSDGRSKTLITFRVNNLFDANRVASILRRI